MTAFFRDENNRNIYKATSFDDGNKWEPKKKTVLPNNGSGI
jgi:hypothetical protein